MRPGLVFAVAGVFGGGGGLILFGLGFLGCFLVFSRLEITCRCIKMQYPDVNQL